MSLEQDFEAEQHKKMYIFLGEESNDRKKRIYAD